MRLGSRGIRVALGCAAAAALVVACSSSPGDERIGKTSQAATSFPKTTVDQLLSTGDFNDAFAAAQEFLATAPTDCDANYANLIAATMMVVDSINTYVLPGERNGPPPPAINQQLGTLYAERLELALQASQTVVTLGCTYDLASMPLLIGDASDPIVNGEVRGLWTTRTASLLGAIHSAFLYDFQTLADPQPVSLPDGGQSNPDLPPLLAAMKQFLQLNQALLFTQPTTPAQLQGGWFDRNGDRIPDSADELLIDIFVPGTNRRVFDFSDAEFVPGQALPQLPLTPTFALPPPRCGYQKFHIDDLASGANVSGADGLTFSPDGVKAGIPLTVDGKSQIYSMNLDGSDQTCLTCGQPGNNDGTRWRPFPADVILFVSTRDHPNAIGGDGAGIGQELYAMRPDGSNPTRLTFSDLWATNYHANWSPDGRHIVWGRTENRTWDVMVADFVEDAAGMRLVNQRRIVHDTTWWETHGFTPDERSIITTNTRAGFQSTDIYAIDLVTGFRKRLTSNLTWDEHAHLSPDGGKLAWISSRYQPAAVAALNDGSLSPIYDFFWIVPGIFFEFANPPAGYTTELTMMSTDGTHLQQLTNDNQVVADNQWSEDGRRIIFRQTSAVTSASRIRILTFDDCGFAALSPFAPPPLAVTQPVDVAP
jgi:Tol biopolymer transport system component